MGGSLTDKAVAPGKVQELLAEIFDQYAPALYRYALRMCQDPLEADQIVGDVFSRLLEMLAGGEGPRTNLRAYLFQTAYHIIVDHAREQQRTAPISDTVKVLNEEKDLPSQVEDQILLNALLSAIRNDLTEDQQQVILLRYQENLSLRDVAEIMDRDVNAVKSLQSRAMIKLQKVLQKQT